MPHSICLLGLYLSLYLRVLSICFSLAILYPSFFFISASLHLFTSPLCLSVPRYPVHISFPSLHVYRENCNGQQLQQLQVLRVERRLLITAEPTSPGWVDAVKRFSEAILKFTKIKKSEKQFFAGAWTCTKLQKDPILETKSGSKIVNSF